ncbi:cyanidin 3-O-glucoside 5-O-glucosyltransferase (acyl-glucose)-like isoform X2 [Apium graveolens]|uniref:cyanidin 3-O-glucoside 5-O-glucosyltransferase (acyl-glucose)-like isoform X2 n=1 Tax=Apium graveolens TaxID=4045 RepID=UPI003D797978
MITGTSMVMIFVLMTLMVEMKIDKLEAVKSFSRLDFPLLLTLFLVLALHLTRWRVQHLKMEGHLAFGTPMLILEEVHLMVETGLEAYRFSISWSRLIPNGIGAVNLKGLQFYNNLINELINHGKLLLLMLMFASENLVIECCIGLPSTNPMFLPITFMILEYSSLTDVLLPLEQIVLKAVQHGFIGIDLYAYWYVPYTNAVEDAIATERAYDFFIGWFLNPLVYGDYPDIMKKNAGTRIPTFTKLESRLVKGSFDLLGMNHYKTIQVEDMSLSLQMDVRDFTADMAVNLILNDSNVPQGQLPSNPTGLRDLLEHLKNHGNPPIYIYENGQSTIRNGTLHDIPRVQYIQSYIGSLLDAIRNGSSTRGYFIWSFLDVFELIDGYDSGYGLYYVDLDDKDLTKWYSNFLKGSSTSLDQDILKENQTGVDDSTMTVAEAEIAERSVGTTIEF